MLSFTDPCGRDMSYPLCMKILLNGFWYFIKRSHTIKEVQVFAVFLEREL